MPDQTVQPDAASTLSYGIGGETFVYTPAPILRAVPKRKAQGRLTKLLPDVLKYIFFFGLFSALWLAKIGGIMPFAFAALYALVHVRQNPYALCAVFVLSAVATLGEMSVFYSAVVSAGVLAATALGAQLSRRRLGTAPLVAAGAVGQAAFALFSAFAGAPTLLLVLNVVFALVFCYVAGIAFRPLFRFRLKYKLTDVERAAAAIVTAVAAAGIAAANIGDFRFLYMAAFFAALLASKCIGRGTGIVVGLCFGVGGAFFSYSVTDIALITFVAAVAAIFADAPRILTALSALAALVLFELYFNVEYEALVFDLISAGIGGLLFVLIPKRAIEHLCAYYFQPHAKLAARHLVNRNRQDMRGELIGVATVLSEMSELLLPGERAALDVAQKAGEEAVAAVCAACGRYAVCKEGGLNSAIIELCASTQKNGRAYVTDLPKLMDLGCTQIARMIACTNERMNVHRATLQKRREDERLKNELAGQFEAVSGIIRTAADRFEREVEYDLDIERAIVEELAACDVMCSEAMVSTLERTAVTLIVRADTVDEARIAKVLEKMLRLTLSAPKVSASPVAGYTVLCFEKKPTFDALFSLASSAKEKAATGDTHAFMRIGADKCLLALSDGMGSGVGAERVSEAAIGLIESFYRAGFPGELTLSAVNRFMMYAEGDAFAAIDIAVIDLNTLKTDIIKIGTPASYIKSDNGVTVLEGNSLPMGMVGEMVPSVTTRTLSAGDTVVFVSDGITDCFSDPATLTSLVNNESGLNPKILAERILAAAAHNGGKVKDDMTVLTLRLFDR